MPTFIGDAGNDLLRSTRGDDVLIGGEGDDILIGGRGKDVLLGRNGADVLFGGRGDDVLSGGYGADKLFGGPGADMLSGGSDPDQFFFNWFGEGLSTGDVIADWRGDSTYPGRNYQGDKIMIVRGPDRKNFRELAPDEFVVGSKNKAPDGTIVAYNDRTGDLFVSADGKWHKVVHLIGAPDVSHTDVHVSF